MSETSSHDNILYLLKLLSNVSIHTLQQCVENILGEIQIQQDSTFIAEKLKSLQEAIASAGTVTQPPISDFPANMMKVQHSKAALSASASTSASALASASAPASASTSTSASKVPTPTEFYEKRNIIIRGIFKDEENKKKYVIKLPELEEWYKNLEIDVNNTESKYLDPCLTTLKYFDPFYQTIAIPYLGDTPLYIIYQIIYQYNVSYVMFNYAKIENIVPYLRLIYGIYIYLLLLKRSVNNIESVLDYIDTVNTFGEEEGINGNDKIIINTLNDINGIEKINKKLYDYFTGEEELSYKNYVKKQFYPTKGTPYSKIKFLFQLRFLFIYDVEKFKNVIQLKFNTSAIDMIMKIAVFIIFDSNNDIYNEYKDEFYNEFCKETVQLNENIKKFLDNPELFTTKELNTIISLFCPLFYRLNLETSTDMVKNFNLIYAKNNSNNCLLTDIFNQVIAIEQIEPSLEEIQELQKKLTTPNLDEQIDIKYLRYFIENPYMKYFNPNTSSFGNKKRNTKYDTKHDKKLVEDIMNNFGNSLEKNQSDEEDDVSSYEDGNDEINDPSSESESGED